MERRSFLKWTGLGALVASVAPSLLEKKEARRIVKALPANAIATIMLADVAPLCFYEVEGQRVFPVYGERGGLQMYSIAYLMKKGDARGPLHHDTGLGGKTDLGNGWAVYGIRVYGPMTGADEDGVRRMRQEIQKGVYQLMARTELA